MHRRRVPEFLKNGIGATLCTLALAGAAWAQAEGSGPMRPMRPQPPVLDPKACSERDRLTLDDTQNGRTRDGTTGSDLSDRLARTDGVICPPPDVGPDMRVPAPGTGRTPVIPPPGDADPTVRPK